MCTTICSRAKRSRGSRRSPGDPCVTGTTAPPRRGGGTGIEWTRTHLQRREDAQVTRLPVGAADCHDEPVRIFHIATLADWAEARRSGVYTTSTRGVRLAEAGFIHASRADQWQQVRAAFYADVAEPLVLLEIDTDLLGVPVVEESAAPDAADTFPHVYGAIPVAAVVAVTPLPPQCPRPVRPPRRPRPSSA